MEFKKKDSWGSTGKGARATSSSVENSTRKLDRATKLDRGLAPSNKSTRKERINSKIVRSKKNSTATSATKSEEATIDDETGVPLNKAAHHLVALASGPNSSTKAKENEDGISAQRIQAVLATLQEVPRVDIAEGRSDNILS